MNLKQLAALTAVVGTAIAAPPEPRPSAGHIPDWLDTDEDGIVSEAERQAFSESRRNAEEGVIHMWDTNEDGVVDDEERTIAIEALRAKIDERRCALFLEVAGEDEVLSMEEFTAVGPVSKIPEETQALLFGLLDDDADGSVTKDEFLSAFGGGTTPPSAPPLPRP